MQILLGTNVLLRSIERTHPQYSVCRHAIDVLERSHHELVIVPQVLYEFWAVVTRPVANNGFGMSVSDAMPQLTLMKQLFRLLRDERAIYEIWEQLVGSLNIKGKPAHDARLAAAMHRHSVTHLLTFNAADFVRYRHVTVMEPQDVVAGTASI